MSLSQSPGGSRSPLPAPSVDAEALPIQKPTIAVYLTGGIAVLAVAGLLAYALSGDDAATQKEKGAEVQRAAAVSTGLTADQIKEQQAHLRRTQLALEAVRDEPPAAAAAAPAEAPAEAPEAPAPARKTSATAKPKTTATAKKPAAGSKKKLDGLDSLGSDITSALK